eukprot:6770836-Lingulodinium_polyedra.AAC.1
MDWQSGVHGQAMGCPKAVHGWPWSSHGPLVRPWAVHSQSKENGLSMDCPWTVDSPWAARGFSMARSWVVHGLPVDSP